MEKTYQPFDIEQRWYQHWEKQGYFKPSNQGESYCIMLPPPNVTGSLHMGHGFQDTLMDILIRYHKLSGANTLWQVGTDHAGISTQMVVERIVTQEGNSRQAMGREAFENKIWDWKKLSGNQITKQLRRMGVSADWSREKFTLDPSMNEAVQDVFIRLYDEGLIYRGKRLVNWDPHFRSAISDLEVISTEEQGSLWHLRYPLENSEDYLIVATTRPETMLGDVAVAVHPDDERYQKFLGKQICLPLTNRLIPIIADEYVDKEFGTGCVKITPAHDFNDYEMGKRHQLPLINIFTDDAKINENAPKHYQGLDRFDARKQIVADLEKFNLLEKIEPHTLKVPRADRGHTIVEPYLTDQWFVKMESLAQPAIDAVKTGKTRFVPENWSKTYFQWLENIQDWCISRQLWWGHRIPAFYDEEKNIYVARTKEEAIVKYHLDKNIVLTQEEDVLDTWFSSALWPFATLGFPNETPELKTFYPTSVLVTGFDIIFFWVARMMMMGLKFMGEVPFKEVYVHGLIRDSEGHKMSKSKGNVLDPLDLIDGIDLENLIHKRTQGMMLSTQSEKIEKATRKEFPEGIAASGTDALRFTFCALATHGRDIRFDLNRLEGYRNFCNKLWNAARYVLMNVENIQFDSNAISTALPDLYIQSKLQLLTQEVSQHIKAYRFDLMAQSLYEFVWNEFCDWYLELLKPILTNPIISETEKNTSRIHLIKTLESILLLLHPIMPYITEEIFQQIKPILQKNSDSILLEKMPEFNHQLVNTKAVEHVEWLKQITVAIRTIRSEMNVSPAKQIQVIFNKGSDIDEERISATEIMLTSLAKIDNISWLNENESAPPAATAVVGELEILIPLAGLIDKDAELKRLQKEMDKLNIETDKCLGRLNNESYLAKAPADVVTKEQEKVKDMQSALKVLEQKYMEIEALEN